MTSSWLEDYLRENVSPLIGARLSELPDTAPDLDGEFNSGPELRVQKMSAVIHISNDLAMDYGIIPDTRPPPKPPTRRERFRWWRSGLRDRIATSAYERISGQSFPDTEDY